MSDRKRPEPVPLSDLNIPLSIRQKLTSLGSSIACINSEITALDKLKKSQMALIASLAAEYDLPDVKAPDLFTLTLCQGKLTLKEQRLLEEGVTAATIEACKDRGNPYWQIRGVKEKE